MRTWEAAELPLSFPSVGLQLHPTALRGGNSSAPRPPQRAGSMIRAGGNQLFAA